MLPSFRRFPDTFSSPAAGIYRGCFKRLPLYQCPLHGESFSRGSSCGQRIFQVPLYQNFLAVQKLLCAFDAFRIEVLIDCHVHVLLENSGKVELGKSADRSYFLDKKMSITDVAMNSGFSSLSAFNRTFKTVKACSPSDYRRQRESMVQALLMQG